MPAFPQNRRTCSRSNKDVHTYPAIAGTAPRADCLRVRGRGRTTPHERRSDTSAAASVTSQPAARPGRDSTLEGASLETARLVHPWATTAQALFPNPPGVVLPTGPSITSPPLSRSLSHVLVHVAITGRGGCAVLSSGQAPGGVGRIRPSRLRAERTARPKGKLQGNPREPRRDAA